MQAVRSLRHKNDTRQIGERVAVSEGYGPALLDAQIEDFELTPSDAREDVAHAVVVAEFRMLIRESGIACLLGPEACFFDPGSIAGHEHSAAGGCDDLVPVEGEYADVAKCSGGPISVCRAESFGGVFEHRHVIAAAECQDRVHIGALPIEVHHYESTWQLFLSRARSRRTSSRMLGSRFQVAQSLSRNTGSAPRYRIGLQLAAKVSVGQKYFVAGAHAEKAQPEMDGGGAAAERHGRQADAAGELLLEGSDVGADCGQPV